MAGASTEPAMSVARDSALTAGADSGTTSEMQLVVLEPIGGR